MINVFTTLDKDNYRWWVVTINHTNQTKAFKLLLNDYRYNGTQSEALCAYAYIYNALPSFLQDQAICPEDLYTEDTFRLLGSLIRLAQTIKITHT